MSLNSAQLAAGSFRRLPPLPDSEAALCLRRGFSRGCLEGSWCTHFRNAGELLPWEVHFEQRKTGGEKEPAQTLFPSSLMGLSEHHDSLGFDQAIHYVFSWSCSQFPNVPLCTYYFSIPDWLPFYSFLGLWNCIPLFPTTLAYTLASTIILQTGAKILLFVISFLIAYLWMPLQFKFSFKYRQPGCQNNTGFLKTLFV